VPLRSATHSTDKENTKWVWVLYLQEMALAALIQYEIRWWVELASFDEKYGTFIADHPAAKERKKKERNTVHAAVVQIIQLGQNSTKENGNGAKWK
jgi:hypothetical protein